MEKERILPEESGDLRLGILGRIWFEEILEAKTPKQLDLIDYFFPGLLIEEIPSDGGQKVEAEYIDTDHVIRAVRYHESWYTGGSKRVTQIAGRLIGTAKGSQEKERSTAALLQKFWAELFCTSTELIDKFRGINLDRFLDLPDKKLEDLANRITVFLNAFIDNNLGRSFEERQSRLFPLDMTAVQILVRSATYQMEISTVEAWLNVWMWLLLGALLRNEVIQLYFYYLSSFRPRIHEETEDDEDHLDQYHGNDLDSRFPDIDWYCDRCGELLNEQPGFDDHKPFWICTKCGYRNRLQIDQIYDTEHDYERGQDPVDPDEFYHSIKVRTDQVEEEMKTRTFKPGDIVQHFKRETLTEEKKKGNKYLYRIIGTATHTETREPMMVYQALYDDCGIYVRPLHMFLSPVDDVKYPYIRQKYRFELIHGSSTGIHGDGSSGEASQGDGSSGSS